MSGLAEAVIDLGRLALVLGATDRTACYHPGGLMKESDTDHTVAVGWLAAALAQRLCPDYLDVGLVAQFALIHDAVEVYAGDTPTLEISSAGRAAKEARERAAAGRLADEFGATLPWLPETITWYERQLAAEARFVRAVDKIAPKITHLLDGGCGLVEAGQTAAKLRTRFEEQAKELASYACDFPELLDLWRELAERTVALLAAKEATHA